MCSSSWTSRSSRSCGGGAVLGWKRVSQIAGSSRAAIKCDGLYPLPLSWPILVLFFLLDLGQQNSWPRSEKTTWVLIGWNQSAYWEVIKKYFNLSLASHLIVLTITCNMHSVGGEIVWERTGLSDSEPHSLFVVYSCAFSYTTDQQRTWLGAS